MHSLSRLSGLFHGRYHHAPHASAPTHVGLEEPLTNAQTTLLPLTMKRFDQIYLLSNFPKVSEACPNSLKIRWETARWKPARWKTVQLTAGWPTRAHTNLVSSPSMAQSSTYMVLRAVELDRSLLAPPTLLEQIYSSIYFLKIGNS